MKKDHVTFKRRPFFTPLWLSGAAILVGFAVLVFAAWEWANADSTIIILIQPGEKVTNGAVDPRLAPTDLARAALLARMLGAGQWLGHIDAIYTPSTPRDKEMIEPLAQRLAIAPVVLGSEDSVSMAHRVLREHRGGRALIVGHPDTVPKIVAALGGGDQISPMGEGEDGVMYIVSVPRVGHANTLRVNY